MKLRAILILIILVNINLHAGIGEGIGSFSPTGPLPVELTFFGASVKSDVVLLNWTTATEVNNYGFQIERISGIIQDNSQLKNGEWETIGFVEGHGNSNSIKEYSFVDSKPLQKETKYRLKQIDTNGKYEYSSEIAIEMNLLNKYILEQNYPNPFNPTTVISYSIPKSSNVTVEVFDIIGNTITTLVNQNQDAGSYKVNFNATELSNGIYFYKISAGEFYSVKKMMLIK